MEQVDHLRSRTRALLVTWPVSLTASEVFLLCHMLVKSKCFVLNTHDLMVFSVHGKVM